MHFEYYMAFTGKKKGKSKNRRIKISTRQKRQKWGGKQKNKIPRTRTEFFPFTGGENKKK